MQLSPPGLLGGEAPEGAVAIFLEGEAQEFAVAKLWSSKVCRELVAWMGEAHAAKFCLGQAQELAMAVVV